MAGDKPAGWESVAMGKRVYAAEDMGWVEGLTWTDLVVDPDAPQFLLDPKTGERWRHLNETQMQVAESIVNGMRYRDACKAAGLKYQNECSFTHYVTDNLRKSAPFVNYVLQLYIDRKQSGYVTTESHLRRLEELGRRAEKAGKYSAAIAAEVARGKAGGLYVQGEFDENSQVAKSVKDIDRRINQLLEKVNQSEREVKGRVVADQPQIGKSGKS